MSRVTRGFKDQMAEKFNTKIGPSMNHVEILRTVVQLVRDDFQLNNLYFQPL